MRDLYREIKRKARGCRDRDVRIKVELVLLVLKLGSVSEACARRGFSRKFYYLWWNRFKKSGYELWSLEERSRRPRRSPGKISEGMEKRILWLQRRQYGSRMIEAMLAREGIRVSRSTICHVLNKRRKIKKTRRAKLKTHRKRYELVIPGERFQLDVKYVPELVGQRQAYNYVIVDECTRWRFAKAYDSLCAGTTVAFLDSFKKSCPFPMRTIQTDNGQEFTYALNPVAKHIEHPMDIWCRQNHISHRLIPPGVKELNGKVERSHRIDEHYFYWKAPTSNLTALNQAIVEWIEFYNSKRLHGGIGYCTPEEKIQERLKNLHTETVKPELEMFKFKFLRETPRRLTKRDRQILELEVNLQNLLKAA